MADGWNDEHRRDWRDYFLMHGRFPDETQAEHWRGGPPTFWQLLMFRLSVLRQRSRWFDPIWWLESLNFLLLIAAVLAVAAVIAYVMDVR